MTQFPTINKQNVPKQYAIKNSSSINGNCNQKLLKTSAKYLISKMTTSAQQSSSIEDDEIEKLENVLHEFGPNGEICIGYKNTINIYDWLPHKSHSFSESADNKNNILFSENKTLYLVSSIEIKENIYKFFPLLFDRFTHSYKILIIIKPATDFKFLVCKDNVNMGTLDIKVNEGLNYSINPTQSPNFFTVSDNDIGKLHIFTQSSNMVYYELNVKTCNGNSIFDLKNNWLVYCNSNKVDKSLLTSVQLSTKNNLINKLLKDFSKTALDSFIMISEISQSKFKYFFNNNEELNEKDMLNYKMLLIKLYNSINVNSDFITMIDLNSKKTLFQFSVNDGCSNVSISPYDMQLVTISSRGDDINLWDFTKFTTDIVLLDKFIRGKTSSIIESINWSENNRSILCLSRINGSLHNFINESLVNYRESFKNKNKNKNRNKNKSKSKSKTKTKIYNQNPNPKPIANSNHNHTSKNAVGCWCLSNFKFKKTFIVKSTNEFDEFLVVLNKENSLLTIDIKSGLINWLFQIPNKVPAMSTIPTPHETEQNQKLQLPQKQTPYQYQYSFNSQAQVSHENQNPKSVNSNKNLMDRIEIETCKPFSPLYSNKRVEFAKIDDNEKLNLSSFGNLMDLTIKDFKIAGNFHSNKQAIDIKIDLKNADNILHENIVEATIIRSLQESMTQ